MKSVRFSKVVEKSGRPEVYLLMSETDPDFHKALEAGKIMSLSDESHGSGTEFGTVGYDKKRHGQLLLFPKSLKSFAGARIVGIKYDLLSEGPGNNEKDAPAPRKKMTKKDGKNHPKTESQNPASLKPARHKRPEFKPAPKKVIPFPPKMADQDDDDDNEIKISVRRAMRALEKGNSVAAYNILKRIIPDP